jgi:hypothetical protein
LQAGIAPKCCCPVLDVRTVGTQDFHFLSDRLVDHRGLGRCKELDYEVLLRSHARDGLCHRIHSVVCGGWSRNRARFCWIRSRKRSWTGSFPGTQHGKPDSQSAPGTRAATGHQWAAQPLRTPADGKRVEIAFARGSIVVCDTTVLFRTFHHRLVFRPVAGEAILRLALELRDRPRSTRGLATFNFGQDQNNDSKGAEAHVGC